ncbi:MAG: M14 family zinc carboxypeptidase [Nannocystales bacterium]
MRALRSVAALTAVICWLWVGVASASGFPDFDPDREQVLHGRALPKQAPTAGDADLTGPWTEQDGQLDLGAEEGTGNRFWLVRKGVRDVADGLVRARLRPGKRIDGSVIFRAQAGSDLRELSGYELAFDTDGARLMRWDKGTVLPVGPPLEIPRLQRTHTLEVIVYLVGPQIIATVYDGESLDRLGSLAVHETTYTDGRVGFRAGKRAEAMQFGLLSVMDTRVPAPKAKGSGRQGAPKRYGLDADPGTTPFGNTRFVFVPEASVRDLPRELRRNVKARLTGDDGTRQAVVFTDTVGFERIKRAGVPVLTADSNVPWKTFDPDYRVQAAKGPVATRRGFKLDLSYKNADMVEAILRGYHEKYADISTLVELGRSHQGRPIWGLKISDNPSAQESEPSVLFNGSHHASELLSVEYPLDAAAQLLENYGRDREVTRWVDGMEIWVVPMVNPDGNWMFLEESRFASRKNGRDTNLDGFHDPFEGIDLNRNYGLGWGTTPGSSGVIGSKYYRGPHPFSEPESWAMASLSDRQHFAASISFHTVGNAIFVPYTVGDTQTPTPNVPFVIAKQMEEAGLEQPNGRFIKVRANGYPVSGSDQDWLMHTFGTVAYIVEGSHHNPSLEVRTRAIESTRPLWRTLLSRVHSGPRISGHVRTAEGTPVEATVHVKEIQLRAAERWTSRARDGRFDRLLSRPGRYTLEASAPGFAPATVEVKVRGATSVDITLDAA